MGTMDGAAAAVIKFVDGHFVGIAFAAAAGAGLFALRRWAAGGVCRSKARLDGRTVLVTGAAAGIGRETAVDLAARGARVIVACRDVVEATLAADDIRRRSGNANVVVKKLDLASLRSVRRLAREILDTEERLDVLINNAGVMLCQKLATEDGFETHFGVNYLGHFLLTNCLLDLVKRSAPSRIINVSSLAHERGHIYFDDINLDKDFTPQKAYSQSKLANVLFSRELSRRLQGTRVSVFCLHPGIVHTELSRHVRATLPLWRKILHLPSLLFMKTQREGAQTTIHCAVEKSLENLSGQYFSDCKPKAVAPQAEDDSAARRLWDLSASMVGLS
ncbi:retinol dehydrogenase 12-like [Denticeps clupeoides]|uniref:Uncharacterized protein n=1 Tax=Denticeps clupeoides TaxID=299321 RepID=A0AAY4BUP0_9TELE|nr:retinol dehydrogenase 12-like [Denticeps clupeoides]